MHADADQSNLTSLTVDLLSAYVANNTVEHDALSELIKSTHAALKVIDAPEPPAPEEPEHKPAVSVRKSLSSASHIISLIDGKPYQTLKRHLSKHGLTADQYRERYGLPKTYPMVAKAYSESRRAIAEKLGLGRRVKGAQADVASADEPAGQIAEPQTDTPAKTRAASRAPKPVAAKADTIAPGKVKAAPKEAASINADAPAEAKGPVRKTKAAEVAEVPTPASPAKAAPKARTAASPKRKSAPAPASATVKPPRKRAVKTAEPAS